MKGFSSMDFAIAIFISLITIAFTVYFVNSYFDMNLQTSYKYNIKLEEKIIKNYFFSPGSPEFWEKIETPIKPGIEDMYYEGLIDVENTTEGKILSTKVYFDKNCILNISRYSVALYNETWNYIPSVVLPLETCPGGYLKTGEIVFKKEKGNIYHFIYGHRNLSATVVDPNLVGLWKFDENRSSETYDASGYNHTGNLIGLSWTNGVENSAIDFDGVGYISTDQTFSYDYITVCTWVNITEIRNETMVDGWKDSGVFMLSFYDYNESCSNTGSVDNGFAFMINTTDNNVYMVCGNSGKTINQLYHVCGVFDGTKLEIYVNGSREGYYNIGSLKQLNNLGTRIYFGTGGEQKFKGILDEVYIFNTSEDVNKIFYINKTKSITYDTIYMVNSEKLERISSMSFDELKSFSQTNRGFNINVCNITFGKSIPISSETYVNSFYERVLFTNGTVKLCDAKIIIW